MVLSSNDIVLLASVAVIAVAFALWRMLYVSPRTDDESILTDGAVLMISDGLVHQASIEARDLLGDCERTPVVKVLSGFLREDSADARDAVNRLEMTGDPVNMLVYDRDSRAFELIGAPTGGMIRLILRDAGFLDTRLKAAEERLNAADALVQSQNWERVTLRSLVAEAPIIIWNRTNEGIINWADGQIRTRNSTVTADQAVDLIIARTRLNTQPSLVGQPQKSRIEIVVNDGADTISLQVIEVIRPNGDRIGFASDAGTAASAERTLTRFVQTMTETFAHLTVGLAIFDRNQTLALFNPALVQMWQLEPAWLARRPSLRDIVDELRSSRRLPELQDFHKWRSDLLTLFDNTEAADYEELWHLPNGSNIRVLARPHPHGSLAFIFDDVTERMRLEQRYRHSIDLRRVTLDRLNEGIAVFGANGLLQFINQAFHELWGTSSENVYAAMHVRQLIPQCQQLTPDKEIWKRLHSFVTGEDNRREWETRISTHAGYMLNARFAPLPDGSTMAVFTNISDSQRVSVQFAERSFSLRFALAVRDYVTERMKTEVRGPLTSIIDQPVDSYSPELTADIVDDMRSVVGQMDTLSRLDVLCDPPADPVRETVDMVSVAETVAALVSRTAHEAGLQLVLDVDENLPPVISDTCHAHRLLYAIAIFAIERSEPGASVLLSVTVDPEGFTMCVDAQGKANAAGSVVGPDDPDRMLIEYFVGQQNGVLQVAEIQSTGALRITGRFDNAVSATTDAEAVQGPDDLSTPESNVLHLPSVATRD